LHFNSILVKMAVQFYVNCSQWKGPKLRTLQKKKQKVGEL